MFLKKLFHAGSHVDVMAPFHPWKCLNVNRNHRSKAVPTGRSSVQWILARVFGFLTPHQLTVGQLRGSLRTLLLHSGHLLRLERDWNVMEQ